MLGARLRAGEVLRGGPTSAGQGDPNAKPHARKRLVPESCTSKALAGRHAWRPAATHRGRIRGIFLFGASFFLSFSFLSFSFFSFGSAFSSDRMLSLFSKPGGLAPW